MSSSQVEWLVEYINTYGISNPFILSVRSDTHLSHTLLGHVTGMCDDYTLYICKSCAVQHHLLTSTVVSGSNSFKDHRTFL